MPQLLGNIGKIHFSFIGSTTDEMSISLPDLRLPGSTQSKAGRSCVRAVTVYVSQETATDRTNARY